METLNKCCDDCLCTKCGGDLRRVSAIPPQEYWKCVVCGNEYHVIDLGFCIHKT